MNNILKEVFEVGNVGICIKSNDNIVLFQNHFCQTLCSNTMHTACRKGCMNYYVYNEEHPERAEGVQVFNDKLIGDQYFDITLLNNKKYLTTILYPLASKHLQELEYFKDKNLSKREFEIVSMVVKGATNSEIIKKLAISKATLKTHLNNIYKKLPAQTQFDLRRSQRQMRSPMRSSVNGKPANLSTALTA